MAKLNRKNGSTSNILRIFIGDSSVTTGAGLTGLTYASSGLRISTIANNESVATSYTSSNLEDVTAIGTYQAPSSGKCRFAPVDATNHPGVYEIHIADARFAVANARSLLVSITGATNAVPVHCEIDQLAQVDVTTNNDKTGYTLTATPPTAAAIADAVWDEARSGHTTAATFGYYVDAQISAGGTGDITAIDGSSEAAQKLKRQYVR